MGLRRRGVLERISPNPVVTLNHAIAVAMMRGPRAGLELLETREGDDRIARHHRLEAVRAHLLGLAGDQEAALASYRAAARRSTSIPERRYLETRAAKLRGRPPRPAVAAKSRPQRLVVSVPAVGLGAR